MTNENTIQTHHESSDSGIHRRPAAAGGRKLAGVAAATCAFAAVVCPGLAAADDEDFVSPIEQGAWRTSINLDVTAVGTENDGTTGDGTNYGANVQLAIGRFVTQHIELNARLSGNASWNNTDSNRSGGFGYTLGARYNILPENRLNPYIEARVGGRTTISTVNTPNGNRTEVTTAPSVGGSLGAEYFISNSSSIFVAYALDVSRTSDATIYNNAAQVGFSFYF